MHRSLKITGITALVLLLALGTLAAAQAPGALDDDTKAALAAALDDEREARATYGAAIEKYDGAGPFSRIVRAEGHHEAHLLDLYEAYGLEAPENRWLGHAFDLPETAAEACAQAVEWETENAAMFDGFLAREDLPADVRAVFERLGTVSRERHLPAFQRCAAGETAGHGGGMGGGHGMQGGQGMHGGCCGGKGGKGGQGMQGGQGMHGGRCGGQGAKGGQGMQGGHGMHGGKGRHAGEGRGGGCRCGRMGEAAGAGAGGDAGPAEGETVPEESAETAETAAAPRCDRAGAARPGSPKHDSSRPQGTVGAAGVMAGAACPL